MKPTAADARLWQIARSEASDKVILATDAWSAPHCAVWLSRPDSHNISLDGTPCLIAPHGTAWPISRAAVERDDRTRFTGFTPARQHSDSNHSCWGPITIVLSTGTSRKYRVQKALSRISIRQIALRARIIASIAALSIL